MNDQWIKDYGDLNSVQEWDAYTLVGFMIQVLNSMDKK